MFACLLAVSSYSQSAFKPVKVDDVITISFPGEVTKQDTTAQNVHTHQLYLNTDTETFIIQKLDLKNITQDKNTLPDDKEGLLSVYKDFAEGYVNGMASRSYKLLDQGEIAIDGTIGYVVRMKLAKQIVGQARFLNIGDHAYIAGYYNATDYTKAKAEAFFSTIDVAEKHPPQYNADNTSSAYKAGRVAGVLFLLLVAIGIVIYLLAGKRARR